MPRSQRALTLHTQRQTALLRPIYPVSPAVGFKPLSPREHAGRRVGKGGTLGSVQTERHPIPVLAAALGAE